MTAFSDLLIKWNRTINLVSKSQINDLKTRHVDDSLQLLPHIPSDAKVLTDIGSGGGFPGIVLAIAKAETQPSLHFQLIESDQRKAAFLRTAVCTLSLNATVFCERIEQTTAEPADCMTARALAPLSNLLAFASGLMVPEGTAILPKGRHFETELEDAQKAWHFRHQIYPSLTDSDGQVIVVKDIRRA
nr:16S rRNA (guanine(527)-N(7))-methyltransferase RsmG [Loktanella sp. SALINAS62]